MYGIETKKEYGDFQTPIEFSIMVCNYLKNNLQIDPTIIIEPTCGIGNFLDSCNTVFNNCKLLYGIEINDDYLKVVANRDIPEEKLKLYRSSIFDFNFAEMINDININDEKVLIVGNPPWASNSELSANESQNLPQKTNFKNHKGFDAITGISNFDISEYIILDLIRNFKNTDTVVAMLCKNIVAKNVFIELHRTNTNFEYAKMVNFNSRNVFDVSVDSCLLVVKLTSEQIIQNLCQVYDFNNIDLMLSQFGYLNGKFYSTVSRNASLIDGSCCFEWRQGVKHDCSKIMELVITDGNFINGNNEILDIESDLVFPLIKSSHIKKAIIKDYIKYVIVTQKKVKEDTDYIKDFTPNTWRYLSNNKSVFQARKSSIYKNSPIFSMFGIGDYSFSPYKVCVSGFYKKPLFSLLHSDKPVMTDDTCYFISFNTFDDAYVAMLILNSSIVQDFLYSIAFLDSKRPYTKKILERIDFNICCDLLTFEVFQETEKRLGLEPIITSNMIVNFKNVCITNR